MIRVTEVAIKNLTVGTILYPSAAAQRALDRGNVRGGHYIVYREPDEKELEPVLPTWDIFPSLLLGFAGGYAYIATPTGCRYITQGSVVNADIPQSTF